MTNEQLSILLMKYKNRIADIIEKLTFSDEQRISPAFLQDLLEEIKTDIDILIGK